MIVTHRRLNIAQAYKLAGVKWVSMDELMLSGAYGSRQSIHRAIRRMLEYDAASILATKFGPTYRVTPTGMALMGLEKMENP